MQIFQGVRKVKGPPHLIFIECYFSNINNKIRGTYKFPGKSDNEAENQTDDQDVFFDSNVKTSTQELIKKKLSGKKGIEKKGQIIIYYETSKVYFS